LLELTKKDKAFEWNKATQEAFNRLKLVFTTKLVLASFDLEKETRVKTDALDYAISAMLSQPNKQGK
jgi:hypothetical protein